MTTPSSDTPLTPTEREIINELRQAARRRMPSTYVVKVVDGIVMLLLAEPVVQEQRHRRGQYRLDG